MNPQMQQPQQPQGQQLRAARPPKKLRVYLTAAALLLFAAVFFLAPIVIRL